MSYPLPIQNLIDLLSKLPGVGPKTATRYAFCLKDWPIKDTEALSQAIQNLRKTLGQCHLCGRTIQKQESSNLCSICRDPHRNQKIVCVVENEPAIETLEKAKQYEGIYFILGGLLDPLRGTKPPLSKIKALEKRVQKGSIQEVILALNPTTQGEATIAHLKKILAPYKIRLTRLGRGLPSEADLLYADSDTLRESLRARSDI